MAISTRHYSYTFLHPENLGRLVPRFMEFVNVRGLPYLQGWDECSNIRYGTLHKRVIVCGRRYGYGYGYGRN